MSINAPKGSRVRFERSTPEQVAWGGNDDPDQFLERGNMYTVDRMEVHSMHTKVYLVGLQDKKFNSCSFSEVSDAEYFQHLEDKAHGLAYAYKEVKAQAVRQRTVIDNLAKVDVLSEGQCHDLATFIDRFLVEDEVGGIWYDLAEAIAALLKRLKELETVKVDCQLES